MTILLISTSNTSDGFQAVVLLQRDLSSIKQSPKSLLGKQHCLTCCAAYLGRGATSSAGVVMAELEGIRVTAHCTLSPFLVRACVQDVHGVEGGICFLASETNFNLLWHRQKNLMRSAENIWKKCLMQR